MVGTESQGTRRILTASLLDMLTSLDLYIRTSMTGRFGGKRRTKAYGSSLEWTDYREYVPGDDLRRIDWNAVARFDKYYVKNFLDERQHVNHIYLDCSCSMGVKEEKAVMALQLASALGYLSVGNMDRASFRILHGRECEDISGEVTGKEAFITAAGSLSAVVFSGEVDIEEAIKNDMYPGFCNGTSYLISDLIMASGWKNAIDYLIDKKREIVLFHLLSPEEANPGQRGLFEFFDAENSSVTGTKMRLDYGSVRAYNAAYREWCDGIDSFCRSRNVPCVHVLSDDVLSDIILKKAVKAGVIV